jgi:hypothetical protein
MIGGDSVSSGSPLILSEGVDASGSGLKACIRIVIGGFWRFCLGFAGPGDSLMFHLEGSSH